MRAIGRQAYIVREDLTGAAINRREIAEEPIFVEPG
jgi:hypothetical protein